MCPIQSPVIDAATQYIGRHLGSVTERQDLMTATQLRIRRTTVRRYHVTRYMLHTRNGRFVIST